MGKEHGAVEAVSSMGVAAVKKKSTTAVSM